MSKTKPHLIAFSGPKTCGKDTAASALFRQNEKEGWTPFIRMPFAGQANPPEGVKGICAIAFGYSDEQMEDSVLKETETSTYPYTAPRWQMMDVANWFRAEYGANVWVECMLRRLNQNNGDPWAFVVTDLRFPNEIKFLKSEGALILYIERPAAEEKLYGAQKLGDVMALNPSEAHYAMIKENADYVIPNDGTIAQLQLKTLSIVRKHFGYWHPDNGGE